MLCVSETPVTIFQMNSCHDCVGAFHLYNPTHLKDGFPASLHAGTPILDVLGDLYPMELKLNQHIRRAVCRRPIGNLNHMADMVRVITALSERCPLGSFGRQAQPPLAVVLLYLAS